MSAGADRERVEAAARAVLAEHDPSTTSTIEFRQAWFDAGLTWVQFPEGLGGLGVDREHQTTADRLLSERGGSSGRGDNPIGYGIAAPTIAKFAQTPELARSWLRPLATAEEIWCQLFSEPGAGSDLAGLATRARLTDGEWVINGQKVWSSLARRARWGLLLARTDPDQPKHAGITYYVIDMHQPGVDVRLLRQMTGQEVFSEVFLSDAVVPDAHRLGEVGGGWMAAINTLANERSMLGADATRRGAGPIADAMALWATRPESRTAVFRERLATLWIRAEAQRLTAMRKAAQSKSGPGATDSMSKLVVAELNQAIYEFCMDFLGPEASLFGSYSVIENGLELDRHGPVQQRFLRSRANTIEGGTSEIMRNVIAERMLGLPKEARDDSTRPWREVPRG